MAIQDSKDQSNMLPSFPGTKGGYTAFSLLSGAASALFAASCVFFLFSSIRSVYLILESQYANQVVISFQENWKTNLLAVLSAIVAARVFFHYVSVSDRFCRAATFLLFSIYGILGIIWVAGAKVIPASDQGILMESAVKLIQGDVREFSDPASYTCYYFSRFPFQLGFLSYVELFIRLFGENGYLVIAPVLNVFYLIAGNMAVLKITDSLFHDKRITLLTLLLIFISPQPLLGTTLLYGTYPAYALSMWACERILAFIDQRHPSSFILSAALFALAVFYKPNALLIVAAAALLLLLYSIRLGSLKFLVLSVCLVLSAIPISRINQAAYEGRVNAQYGRGLPKIAWAAMSSQPSWMAPGWYNMYCQELFQKTGGDYRQSKEIATRDFLENVKHLRTSGELVPFYSEKAHTMWEEATSQSVWTSRTCDTYGTVGALNQSLYSGPLKRISEREMSLSRKLLFAGMALYGFCLLFSTRGKNLLPVLILLAAFTFHLVFEAKAQYVLTYIPLFSSVCAAGILCFPIPGFLKRVLRAAANPSVLYRPKD